MPGIKRNLWTYSTGHLPPGALFSGWYKRQNRVKRQYAEYRTQRRQVIYELMLDYLKPKDGEPNSGRLQQDWGAARNIREAGVILKKTVKRHIETGAAKYGRFSVMLLSQRHFSGNTPSFEGLSGTASLVVAAMREAGCFELSFQEGGGGGCSRPDSWLLKGEYVPDERSVHAREIFDEEMVLDHRTANLMEKDGVNLNPFSELSFIQTAAHRAREADQEEISEAIFAALEKTMPSSGITSLQAKNDRLEVIDLVHRQVIPQLSGSQGGYFTVLDIHADEYLSDESRTSTDTPSLDELRGTAALLGEVMVGSERFVLKIEDEGNSSNCHWVLKAKLIVATD